MQIETKELGLQLNKSPIEKISEKIANVDG
jgi:hypothetical protein